LFNDQGNKIGSIHLPLDDPKISVKNYKVNHHWHGDVLNKYLLEIFTWRCVKQISTGDIDMEMCWTNIYWRYLHGDVLNKYLLEIFTWRCVRQISTGDIYMEMC